MVFLHAIVILICMALIIYTIINSYDNFTNLTSQDWLRMADEMNVVAEIEKNIEGDGKSYKLPCDVESDGKEYKKSEQTEMNCKGIEAAQNAAQSQKYMEEASKGTAKVASMFANEPVITTSIGSSEDSKQVEVLEKEVSGLETKLQALEKSCKL
tara:strand:+ start:2173 stop:2637 length:465 start_codon:yes stop_codon:yes gene_type:complete